jgi:UDP-glucuronate 4-epimerase
MTPVLLTGCAGFIGMHVAERLLADGVEVVGVDSLNAYYDPTLKRARLERLRHPNFRFEHLDLADRVATADLFARVRPRTVIHLAAQAGVRYSLKDPQAYGDANLAGFLNVLEGCRHHACAHLVFASSSSVYGANTRVPFAVTDSVDHPISLYAATKRANEAMAHSYAHLYGLPCTGLRFFTVYGPWGRPDMAYYGFTRAILAGEPIEVFNHGRMRRDFTYVDDVVEGVVRVAARPAVGDPAWDPARPVLGRSRAPWCIHNIGNDSPVELGEFIATLEGLLGRTAEKRFLPMQAGDVEATWAEVGELRREFGFAPDTPLASGLERFVSWYREYHGI